MGEWSKTASGMTVGQPGPQGAIITRDEENARGVRLTLEEDAARGLYSVTVSIPDWLNYPRFFSSAEAAHAGLEEMHEPLDAIGHELPEIRTPPGDPRTYEAGARLAALMARFP